MKKQTTTQRTDSNAPNSSDSLPLSNRNYVWLAIGFVMIVLGFILMAGGASPSLEEFNYEMFSFRRITLAPILVVAGFAVEVFAILKRFK